MIAKFLKRQNHFILVLIATPGTKWKESPSFKRMHCIWRNSGTIAVGYEMELTDN